MAEKHIDPQDNKKDDEPYHQGSSSTLSMIVLILWYIVLGILGIGLLLFVALFVMCMA